MDKTEDCDLHMTPKTKGTLNPTPMEPELETEQEQKSQEALGSQGSEDYNIHQLESASHQFIPGLSLGPIHQKMP